MGPATWDPFSAPRGRDRSQTGNTPPPSTPFVATAIGPLTRSQTSRPTLVPSSLLSLLPSPQSPGVADGARPLWCVGSRVPVVTHSGNGALPSSARKGLRGDRRVEEARSICYRALGPPASPGSGLSSWRQGLPDRDTSRAPTHPNLATEVSRAVRVGTGLRGSWT